jgi:CubicO group peptidase (beta-lactamase class C family)
MKSCINPGSSIDFFEDLIENFSKDRPLSGSILIGNEQFKVIRHFGYADQAHNIFCSDQTQYLVASITKQFTAAALLKCLEGHKDYSVYELLNKNLSYFFSEQKALWEKSPPNWLEKITLHHLLTHSSGLPSIKSSLESKLRQKNRLYIDEIIQLFENLDLDFEPETTFSYSHSGYLFLEKVIQIISGKSLNKFFEDHFLKPLRLKQTFFPIHSELKKLKQDPIYSNLALGYNLEEKGKLYNLKEVSKYVDMSLPRGAGSLISTASDLLQWSTHFHKGKIITDSLLQLMRGAHNPIDEGPCMRMGNYYGYGLALREENALGTAFIHHGGINGFQSTLLYLPLLDLSFVTLTNVSYCPSMDVHGHYNMLCFEKYFLEVLKKHIGVYLHKGLQKYP